MWINVTCQHYVFLLEINDIIDVLAWHLALKEAPRDHSDGSCVRSAKLLGVTAVRQHKLPYLAR